MSYTEITFQQKNPCKRWLQRQRLDFAVRLARRATAAPQRICDFGAGSGELCKLLRKEFPGSSVICYEPARDLLDEARRTLANTAGVTFSDTVSPSWAGTVDVVFCLEVFEHLPPCETEEALRAIGRVLRPGGKLVAGVPVEIGLPALYKGFYRLAQRRVRRDEDLRNVNLRNVLSATLGYPPGDRSVSQIAPGVNFYYEHSGFDHRRLRRDLQKDFHLVKMARCPFPLLGAWFMPEIYFLAEKAASSRMKAEG